VQEGDLETGWRGAAELLPGRAELVIAMGRFTDTLVAGLEGTPLEGSVRPVASFEDAAAELRAELGAGDVVLLNGSIELHLRRIKLLLEQGSVGCRVKRCSLRWLCEECPHLHADPPESVVLER
jgi:hypothetical protein